MRFFIGLFSYFLLVSCDGSKPDVPYHKRTHYPSYTDGSIYLSPEKTTNVTIKYKVKNLLYSFPVNKGVTREIVSPNGDILLSDGINKLSHVSWGAAPDIAKGIEPEVGFLVLGKESEEFLQKKLDELGFNAREISSIMYGRLVNNLKKNEYNFISFLGPEQVAAEFEIDPKPDSFLQVHVAHRPVRSEEIEQYRKRKTQHLKMFNRKGFAVLVYSYSSEDLYL